MKKNNRIWIYSLIVMGFLVILINSCKKDDPIVKKDAVITWANPADITSGTALSATQLNATADVAGTFVYTPASGTVLSVGAAQNLKVDFTPTDAVNYNTATKTVTINVTEIVWETASFPADLYGKWYSDYDGSFQWNISGSTTITTFNRDFIVHSTYGFAGAEYEYKVITTEGGRWHTFFFKNVTPSNMHATFTNCPSSPIGFDTENEALAASSGYNQYCNRNHR